jgi:hypothetical protein
MEVITRAAGYQSPCLASAINGSGWRHRIGLSTKNKRYSRDADVARQIRQTWATRVQQNETGLGLVSPE